MEMLALVQISFVLVVLVGFGRKSKGYASIDSLLNLGLEISVAFSHIENSVKSYASKD